jgi:hypothetical protein
MDSIATMCSFGARDAGAYLLLCRPWVTAPGFGGKPPSKR